MRVLLGVVLVSAVAALAAPVAPAATLSRADRAAIDRLLDVFVPAAIGRVHSERAWPLTTRKMRLGTTYADWVHGDLTVQPFPVIGKTFHGWTVDNVGRDRADIVLLVHLRKGNDLGLSGVSFDFALKKVHGRWLVDEASAAATFAAEGTKSKILAGNDFGPNSSPDPYSNVKEGLHSGISGGWIYVIPAVLFALVVVLPVGIFTALRVRDRRAYRRSLSYRV